MRTRLYIRDAADWEAVARAHGDRFREVLPANTLIRTGLVGEGYLVEMEARGGGQSISRMKSGVKAGSGTC